MDEQESIKVYSQLPFPELHRVILRQLMYRLNGKIREKNTDDSGEIPKKYLSGYNFPVSIRRFVYS